MESFTLKSYWDKDYIFIENFPYTDAPKTWHKYDKIFSLRDASNAQRFTIEMIKLGFTGKSFAYQDVIDWCNKN